MSENDQTKLKPLFGIHPGKYLTILYTIVILLIVFLLFFLPGILNPGTVYNFESSPENSAVFIDEKYAGATPCKVFVSAGEHEIRISSSFYKDYIKSVTTGHKVFASLFAPGKESFRAELAINDVDGLLEFSFAEFANWGMIDTYFENYQPEPVLLPLMKDLYRSGYADTVTLSSFLYSLMPFVHNEALYSDYKGALIWFEAIQSGDAPAEEDFELEFSEIPFFMKSITFFENLPFWYYSILSDESRENGNDWYPAIQEEYGLFLRDFSNDYPSATAAVTVNGMRFIMLSGGQFLMGADGNSFPYPAAADDFMIMDREVTNELYNLFLNERPQWRLENIEKLSGADLVNQDYLKDFNESAPGEAVNFVSWYAADAFCSWLQTKLPTYLSGYTVRLPDEIEWEWASSTESVDSGIFKDKGLRGPASTDGRMPNGSGLYDLSGNVWEWCSNWYAPASGLITSREPSYNESYIGDFPGVEKAVRGGSWANEKISPSARGSQPPSWCTDFLGFRPVLVKE